MVRPRNATGGIWHGDYEKPRRKSSRISAQSAEPGHQSVLPGDRLPLLCSASGGLLAYQFLVSDKATTCTCPAGQNDRMCKHVAGVQMHMEAEAALEQAKSAPSFGPIEELYS